MEKDLEILNLTVPTLSIRESKALLAGDGYGWEGPSTYDYDLDVGDAPRFDFPQVIEIELPEIVVLGERTATNRDNDIDPIGVPDIDIDIADRDSSPSFDRDDDHSHDQDDDRDNDRDDDYDINNDARDNNEGSKETGQYEFNEKDMLANAQGQGDFQYTCAFAAVFAMLAGYKAVPKGMISWKDLAEEYIMKYGEDLDKARVAIGRLDEVLKGFKGFSDPDNQDLWGLISAHLNIINDKDFYREYCSNSSKDFSGWGRDLMQVIKTAEQDNHPILAKIGMDINGDGIHDVGHMVVILGYERSANGNLLGYKYWDPATGRVEKDNFGTGSGIIHFWVVKPKN